MEGALISEASAHKNRPTLVVQDLVLQRKPFFQLGPISLISKSGTLTVFKGPNGCGKTSLMRAIAGFFPFDKGTIKFSDKNGGKTLLMNGKNGLHPYQTVGDHLLLWARLFYPLKTPLSANTSLQVIEKICQLWGLEELYDRCPDALSQGQKQRVLLSQLSFSRHCLWLLDEPFESLDEKGRDILSDVLESHLKEGGIVIGACHNNFYTNKAQFIELGSGC